jgi:hypothetical protein
MITIPATAAVPYSGFTPRNGTDTISAVQKMMLSTTADPMPAVANAKPASGPLIPDRVSSRYPSAELAALPPGTTFASAFVASWILKIRGTDRRRPALPRVARVRSA